MSAMQGMTPASFMDAGKFDVDQQLGRLASRACSEAEKAAIATRDMARRAGLDRLIRLPTLASLVDRFAQAAALADRQDGRLALLLVDFDGFAPLGDAIDREAGDRLVVEVAHRLSCSVRAADTVCRLAGDQFVVLLTDVAHDSDAVSAARHVLHGLDGGAAAVGIGCSIGISFYPDHGRDIETLIGRADAAMYCAKAMGPGHCRSYSDAAVVECSARLSVLSPVEQRRAGRASPSAPEVGPNDELREINQELLRVSIRARDERDRAQQHLRIALAAADMGRWALDLTTGEAVRSVRHDQLFGYPELLQHWTLDVALARFVPEDRAAVSTALTEARTTGFVDFEHRIQRADDMRVRWLHVTGETVYQGGVASRIVGVVTDVTHRHDAEDELRQARKMEAVGRLSGSVAHDFNNLLFVIGASVDLLARRLVAEERTDQLLDTIRRAVDNGSRLNRQLLGFARRPDALRKMVSIGPLMPSLEQMLQTAVSDSIVVKVRCDEGLWPTRIDRDELEVAILNLAVNARDAMPDGGALTLRACNRIVDDRVAEQWGGRGGEYVAVAMVDGGVGMTDDVVRRAFEPLFTTKPAGRGTGLGLSQVHAFAKESGGFVSIASNAESSVQRGTIVTIHLPRRVPSPSKPEVVRHAAGTVLVVEDDPGVRATANAMLCDLGYEVIEAEAADAAHAIVSSDTPIDLVLGDVVDVGCGRAEVIGHAPLIGRGRPGRQPPARIRTCRPRESSRRNPRTQVLAAWCR